MSELKGKAIQGIRWTTLSAIITGGGGLLQLLILVRFLERADFGLMAIVNVVLGLSVQLIDMGFGTALLREKAPGAKTIDAIFTINMAMGLVFGLLACLLAPVFSTVYEEPLLRNMMFWMAPNFIFSGFSMVFQTLLQKSLRFKALAFAESTAFILSFATAIGCAVSGYGVYSLVWATLVRTGTLALLLAYTGFSEHRPALYFSWAAVQPMWQFSSVQTLEKMFNYANLNFDNLVVGKVLGKEVLGVYEVCKRLLIQPMFLINPIVTKVSGPVMVQVQDDIPRLRNIVFRAFQLTATFNVPLYTACILGAGLIVPIIFGEKWSSGIEPFRWLAVVFLLRTLINPLGGLLIAKNRIHHGLYAQFFISLALIAAVVWGLKTGLLGMIQVLVGGYAIMIVLYLYISVKPIIKVRMHEWLLWILAESVAALTGFLLSYIVAGMVESGWFKIVVYGGLGSLFYLLILVLLRPKIREDFRQLTSR